MRRLTLCLLLCVPPLASGLAAAALRPVDAPTTAVVRDGPACVSPAVGKPTPTLDPVARLTPSVVVVGVRVQATRGRTRDLHGSGLCVGPDLIVTCRHVVAGALALTVTLHDGTTLPAAVVISDPSLDLAVLRVRPARPLPAAALSTAPLRQGDPLLVLGHPLGYRWTLTRGVVSALGRSIEMPSGHTLTGLIQTDAGINPGNSGGPVLTPEGEVVGIAVALRDDAHGIGFAVPIAAVRGLLARAQE